MFRFCLILIFPCILHHIVIGAESTNEKNKLYYKPTGAIQNETALKNVIPIVIEGQPPLSELSSTRSEKETSVRKIIDKENKTVPRKGVSIKSNENFDNLSAKTRENNITRFNTVHELDKHPVSTLKSITNNANRLHVAPVSESTQIEEVNNTVSSTPETRKTPKPKPIVTIGEKEADEPIPASPTNKSPFAVPRKIDYIVPGVITVTALPLLGIAFYVLYKRGRDYWDKRHYRRMDFLIDGMYNE